VVEVNGIEGLKALGGKKKIQSKIVFFNKPMDPANINTFQSYRGCCGPRYSGASPQKRLKIWSVGVMLDP